MKRAKKIPVDEYEEPKRIIVDFDGTICGFAFPECGPPEPGVREALHQLHEEGFEIVIHSCRTATFWKGIFDVDNRLLHIGVIVKYMEEHDLEYDSLLIDRNFDKPMAQFYVDDRGVPYRGAWSAVVKEIRARWAGKERRQNEHSI
jgi:hypothetical protein